MMKKLLLSLALLSPAAFATPWHSEAAAQSGDWKLFNTYDYYLRKVVDTPKRTYFLPQNLYFTTPTHEYYNSDAGFLWVYDKEADELIPYNSRNYLHDKNVVDMFYNPDGRYLLIAYENGNIDLLHDNDDCYSIPGLVSANLSTGKRIYDATFDKEKNLAYLATDFGYVVIDDKKNVIKESHVYDKALTQVVRVGDRLLATASDGLYESPASDRHSNWSSFTKVSTPDVVGNVLWVLPLSGDKMALVSDRVYTAEFDADGKLAATEVNRTNYKGYTPTRDGWLLNHKEVVTQISRDGKLRVVNLPSDRIDIYHGSWDFEDFWFMAARRGGFSSLNLSSTGTWTERSIGDHGKTLVPNGPAAYHALTFSWSPEYGMLAAGGGLDRVIISDANGRHQVCGYKDGEWSHYGSGWLTDSKEGEMRDGYGATIDPADPNKYYCGTRYRGLFSVDMSTGKMMEYSRSGDKNSGKAGFYAVLPQSTWDYCMVSRPEFDADQTLWFMHDTQSVSGSANPLWYWKKEDRLANRYTAMKSIPVKGYKSHNNNRVLPLTHQNNRNLLVMANRTDNAAGFYVMDHGGTLDVTSDDRVVYIDPVIDRDGNTLHYTFLYDMMEDPATGQVWITSSDGVFHFDPRKAFSSDFRVNRVKVARNDGTNLADYLLDGVPVHDITIDGAGRKWFATLGNGVTVTNSDGSEIITTYTAENSYLPSNTVFAVQAEPNSNAIWMGTKDGICVYHSDATPAADNYDNVVAYPNPVRPDYYGYVTIEGLMDQSLVKILDSAGNLIKELGVSQGGMITWDVANTQGRRVNTGVYYIAASNAGSGEATVGKILVVN